MPTTDKRPLKVFLCHAHSDATAVRALYNRLVKDGVDAWLDKEKLLPGQDFELEIRKAVCEADVVIVCLSRQFVQAGFKHKEVKWALDTAMEQPEGEIFIIPLRLEECETLESLGSLHWVDYFVPKGYEILARSLQARAEKSGAVLYVTKQKSPKNITSLAKEMPKGLHPLPSIEKTDDSDFGGCIIVTIIIVVGILLSTQFQLILKFLYDLLHWQYFEILVLLWLIVDIVWIDHWKALLGRLGKLVTKPLIFQTDEEPDDPPLYPRILLEQLAGSSRLKNQTNIFAQWMIAQRNRVFDPENPLRTLGYLISLALFMFFLVADAITITNLLWLMGTISDSSMSNMPEILQRVDLAILGGAVLAAVIGVWVLAEFSGRGDLINTSYMSAAEKKLYKLFATIAILIAMFIMLVLAVQRLINLNLLVSNRIMDVIYSFILYVLLAIVDSTSKCNR